MECFWWCFTCDRAFAHTHIHPHTQNDGVLRHGKMKQNYMVTYICRSLFKLIRWFRIRFRWFRILAVMRLIHSYQLKRTNRKGQKSLCDFEQVSKSRDFPWWRRANEDSNRRFWQWHRVTRHSAIHTGGVQSLWAIFITNNTERRMLLTLILDKKTEGQIHPWFKQLYTTSQWQSPNSRSKHGHFLQLRAAFNYKNRVLFHHLIWKVQICL